MTQQELKASLLENNQAWKTARSALRHKAGALAAVDLSDVDLSNRDLADLDFTGSDFFNTSFERANLKNGVFSGADFTHANLARADLYKANLQKAVLQEADLSGAELSYTDCRNADFRGANLKGVKFCEADLRGADFSHCDLSGADLTRANITGAKFHFAQFSDANVMHLVYGTYLDMTGLYYGVRGIDATFGNAIFVRDAKDQDYIDTLHHALLDLSPGFRRNLRLFLFNAWKLIDHGRSLAKVAFYAFIIATFYGFIYLLDMVYDWQIMDYSNSAKTWFTPFYYSVVTYTTLGFGDVTADSLFGEIFVISEVILGYFTLGLLLAILANTIARRS